MTTSQNPVETLVDSSKITLSTEHTERLKDDLARGICNADDIGKRYGLGNEKGLRKYLIDHPWIIKEAKESKAFIESDMGTGERIKTKSQYAYEHVIPSLAGIALDTKIPARDRIEAAKELRHSGVIGESTKNGAVAGNQFSLTINFPGGKTEKISTTVITQDELPAPDSGLDSDNNETGAE